MTNLKNINQKNFMTKHKRKIATALISFALGSGFYYLGSSTKEEYEANLPQLEEAQNKLNVEKDILGKVSTLHDDISNQKLNLITSVSSLDERISNLNAEINSKEEEKKAKEEAERQAQEDAEKQAKEEAERQAQEEAEKKAQEDAERQAREESEKQAKEEASRIAAEQSESQKNTSRTNNNVNSNTSSNNTTTANNNKTKMVWKTKSGKKYHSSNNCGKTDSKSATQITLGQAQSLGLGPCSNCY